MSSCDGECAKCEIPPGPEWRADGVWIKQMLIPKPYDIVPQHSHTYDHISLLAKGSIRAWKDGEFYGDFTAPEGIFIAAGVKHIFQALEPETIIYCIHNTHGEDVPRVRALNDFKLKAV